MFATNERSVAGRVSHYHDVCNEMLISSIAYLLNVLPTVRGRGNCNLIDKIKANCVLLSILSNDTVIGVALVGHYNTFVNGYSRMR